MKEFYTYLALIALLLLPVSCREEGSPGDSGVRLITFAPEVDFYEQMDGPVEDAFHPLGVRRMQGHAALYLHAYTSEWEDGPDTRSAPVTAVHSTFDVSAYAFLGTWNDQNKPNLFHRETMTRDGSSWTGEASMAWPGADYSVRFGAVSPSPNYEYGLWWDSSQRSPGMPQITCRIKDAVASQVDLLECVSEDYPGDGSTAGAGVSLTFRHALTAVTFRVNDFGMAGTVKSVTLSGVKRYGKHVVGSGVWTDLSENASYAFTGLNTAFAATGETAITSGSNTLILLPQQLGENALLTVVMTLGNSEKTLTASLAGQVWEPGKKITYTIAPSEDDWMFSYIGISDVRESVEDGVPMSVATITSFRQHVLGFKQAQPWRLKYARGGTDGNGLPLTTSTPPAGLTAVSPLSGNGGTAGETITATATRSGLTEQRFTIVINNSSTDYDTDGEVKTFDIVLDGVRAIDLGLRDVSGNKILFADRNLGAENPWDYGDFYAWGETEKRYSQVDIEDEGYTEGSYLLGMLDWDNDIPFTSTGAPSLTGTYTAASTCLDLPDDVAYIQLGNPWRMPTAGELQWLTDQCTCTWTSDYQSTGTAGLEVTGPSGATIFLPASGMFSGDYNGYGNPYANAEGCYWSSSFFEDDPVYSSNLQFGYDMSPTAEYGSSPWLGASVRAVCVKR